MGRANQCQECGNWGHNRRGCPRIIASHAKVEAAAKKYGIKKSLYATSHELVERINAAIDEDLYKDGEPVTEKINYIEKWHWLEYEERKLAQVKKNARPRSCGFCGENGHNARTCEDKKQHLKDCNAMRGLAHRVVAVCLEKAGIVPGALMQFRDWDYETNEYCQRFAIVTGLDWSKVAPINHSCIDGLPRSLSTWFSAPFIQARMPAGDTKLFKIPRNIPQQCNYNYYEEPSALHDLASPVIGGSVNKNNGWQGDNVTLISPSVSSIYRYDSKGITDDDLNPIVEKLLTDAGTEWSNY